MIRNIRKFGLFALLPLGVAACSGAGTDPNVSPGTVDVTRELRSDVARGAPTAGAEAAAVADLSEFAWGFYTQLDQRDRNFVYSPYSIAAAAAMLSAGAAGETLAQLQSALRFSRTDPALHEGHNALSLLLESRNREASQAANAQVLRVSNDFWMLPELEPSSAFLDTLAREYDAGLQLAPFDTKPEESRKAINQKISRDTGALIPELLPEGSIDPSVVFVLTNALYFKSRWQSEFAKSATKPAAFTLLDGGSTDVATMQGRARGGYFAGDGFFAVSLPYDGDELDMVFVVPDVGTFSAFASTVSGERVRAIAAGLAPAFLEVSLPKFTIDATIELAEELKQAGVVDAFLEAKADFRHIADNIFISGAFHQAKVILDEQGTEAAAATAFVGSTTSAPPEPTVARIDRPFLFFVRDKTGAVLFLGHVVAPK